MLAVAHKQHPVACKEHNYTYSYLQLKQMFYLFVCLYLWIFIFAPYGFRLARPTLLPFVFVINMRKTTVEHGIAFMFSICCHTYFRGCAIFITYLFQRENKPAFAVQILQIDVISLLHLCQILHHCQSPFRGESERCCEVTRHSSDWQECVEVPARLGWDIQFYAELLFIFLKYLLDLGKRISEY